MEKPDLYPEIEWFEGMEVVRSSSFEKAKKYIDQLESEKKELIEGSAYFVKQILEMKPTDEIGYLQEMIKSNIAQ